MKKRFAITLTTIGTLIPTAVFATEATGTANQAVVSHMTSVANDMVATGTSIIPVALTVVGLSLVVVYGIKMFKRIANK